MTEKEKIILKHTQLAKEYSDLANSDHLLSAKEWEKINIRMNEILVEIDELKKIEKTWEEFQTDGAIESLKPRMMSIEDVANECKCSRQQVAMWLEIGLLKAIKTGKGHMIPREEFERFIRDYLGHDISNKKKAAAAYEVVNGG